MKKWIALWAVWLICMGCFCALADPVYPEGIESALKASAFPTSSLLACAQDPAGRVTVALLRDGDALPLVLLKKEDGAWRINGYNATIATPDFNRFSLSWTPYFDQAADGSLTPREEGYFWLEMQKTKGSGASYQGLAYRDLRFGPSADIGWELLGVTELSSTEDHSPFYHLIQSPDDKAWHLQYYEMIHQGRSDLLDEITVPQEDMAAFEDLRKLDFSALLSFMQETGTPENESAAATGFYYNPDGGKYYHADQACPSVSTVYWPLTPLPSDFPGDPAYAFLRPCPFCNPQTH